MQNPLGGKPGGLLKSGRQSHAGVRGDTTTGARHSMNLHHRQDKSARKAASNCRKRSTADGLIFPVGESDEATINLQVKPIARLLEPFPWQTVVFLHQPSFPARVLHTSAVILRTHL